MAERGGVITIDGPSGSGKSTISRLLAGRLHYTYLDTGGMYRAVGLAVLRAGLDLDSATGRSGLDRLLQSIDIRLAPGRQPDEDTRVFLNGEEVSSEIRTAEMGMLASRVSAEPTVREKLTALQRECGRQGGIVAEGRDTGTVVFPSAEHKFFLDAAAEERARRRQQQLREKGQEVDFQLLLEQIIKRDRDDSSRSLAPLKAAAEAMVIDTSNLSIPEVVGLMISAIENRHNHGALS